MSHDPAHVALELSGAEAWELAQFVKRVGWEIPETPANRVLREALAKLQQALRDQGYAPREGAPGAAAALRQRRPSKVQQHRARPDHQQRKDL